MVGVSAAKDSTAITIHGHGFSILKPFELAEGLWVEPRVGYLEYSTTEKGCSSFSHYAAAVHGNEIGTFQLTVHCAAGQKMLVTKAWNALWIFHLLSVAAKVPCLSLYTESNGVQPHYHSASPNPFVRPLDCIPEISTEQLEWAKSHFSAFDALLNSSEFLTAMRSYVGSQHLPHDDVRTMLVWAGIEGLLSVDAELNRRIALYAALVISGSSEEKVEFFKRVKSAYAVRSKVVHGGKVSPEKLKAGYKDASDILVRLLARCVEIGRVPSPPELDKLAVLATVQ